MAIPRSGAAGNTGRPADHRARRRPAPGLLNPDLALGLTQAWPEEHTAFVKHEAGRRGITMALELTRGLAAWAAAGRFVFGCVEATEETVQASANQVERLADAASSLLMAYLEASKLPPPTAPATGPGD